MLPLKDLVLAEFDSGIAVSSFRIIFPSDNSSVEVDEFIILLISSLSNGSLLIHPFVFRKILPLNGLWSGYLVVGIFEVEA